MNRPLAPLPAPHVSRRAALAKGASSLAGLFLLSQASPARATPAEMTQAMNEVLKGAKPQMGRVTLDMPPLVENGNSVPLTVSVASEMTGADMVRAIHVFNEKNPQPHVIHATFGPLAGRARLSTRIRLNDAQRIVALAEMADGRFFMGEADVIVTLAACVETLTEMR